MIEVVAAFLCQDGRFLACQRPPHKARGMCWEFPGGKIEPGETMAQALTRELREELGVSVQVGRAVFQTTYAYPDVVVQLTFLYAKIQSGQLQCLEHLQFCWLTPMEAELALFCSADQLFLQKLQQGEIVCQYDS